MEWGTRKRFFMFSAMDLDINQGDDNHCSRWISQDDSRKPNNPFFQFFGWSV